MNEILTFVPFFAIRLLLAHILSEYVIWNLILRDQESHRFLRILGYAIMRTALVYTAASDWSNYWIPVLAFAASIIVEIPKSRTNGRWCQLVLRHTVHVLTLLAIWAVAVNPSASSIAQVLLALWSSVQLWIIALTYALVIWPAGYLTGVFTAPWRESIVSESGQGLQNAGLWIGRLERILIVTAIFVNQFALIGFLVAAKSILRFADIQTSKNRQEAEYILVGTLFSFTTAIVLGLLAKATLTYISALAAG